MCLKVKFPLMKAEMPARCIEGWTIEMRYELLLKMWSWIEPACFFRNSGVTPPEWDREAAIKSIKGGYIDYFQGRMIKADLSKATVTADTYEQVTGLSVSKFCDEIENR